MKKATVMDVAEATGFSRSSVYSALKNRPDISKKTTLLIQKKAEEMGFSLDPVFSELGVRRWSGKTSTSGANIAFFIPEHFFEFRKNRLDQLKRYARSKGYHLSLYTPQHFHSVEQANREFEAKGIRGIAASFLDKLDAGIFVSNLNVDHKAIVAGEMNHHLFHSIALNWSTMVSTAIQQLVQKGYQNVSIFLHRSDPLRFYDDQRIGAVAVAKMKFPIQINLHFMPEPSAETYRSPEQGKLQYEQSVQALKQDHPDAIIGWSDRLYWQFHAAGYRMPQEFGYISLFSEKDTSGMKISFFDLWKLEIDRVIELIRNQEFGRPPSPTITLYTPTFIDRGTA